VVVLNMLHNRIIDGVRGQHPTYVFTWGGSQGRRHRFCSSEQLRLESRRRRAAARLPRSWGGLRRGIQACSGADSTRNSTRERLSWYVMCKFFESVGWKGRDSNPRPGIRVPALT